MFEATVLDNGVRYQYGFAASGERFLEEWLYAWPHGKKQVWFERTDSTFKFGENLRGENKLIEEVTRPNALFLSAAVQHRHEQLHSIYKWFRRLQAVNVSVRRRVYVRPPTEYVLARLLDDESADSRQLTLFESEIADESILLNRFRSLLQTADVGIVDLAVKRNDDVEDTRRLRRPQFVLRHRSTFDDAWLPLEEESHGTQTLFRLALPVLEAIETGGVLLVDELEASLHPALAREIVRQFNDPQTNPRGAQLICTTHDTNLLGTTLGEPLLRRDQVWLTEKDREGATVLYPLTDFKPRKAENLERGYLQGRYGAIPFLGEFSVAAE
jgi:predicted ATPase